MCGDTRNLSVSQDLELAMWVGATVQDPEMWDGSEVLRGGFHTEAAWTEFQETYKWAGLVTYDTFCDTLDREINFQRQFRG